MKNKKSFNITFFHEYKTLSYPGTTLQRTAEKIYRDNSTIRDKAINVILVSDYTIRKLNNEYRDRDSTTDVLSFPFQDGDFLGEVYISLQRATIQARRFSCSYTDEVNRLFVHGMLHLLGYDHLNEKERKSMEAQEKRYY